MGNYFAYSCQIFLVMGFLLLVRGEKSSPALIGLCFIAGLLALLGQELWTSALFLLTLATGTYLWLTYQTNWWVGCAVAGIMALATYSSYRHYNRAKSP